MRVFIEHTDTGEMLRHEIVDDIDPLSYINMHMMDYVYDQEPIEDTNYVSFYKLGGNAYEASVRAMKIWDGSFEYDIEILDITPSNHDRDWINL